MSIVSSAVHRVRKIKVEESICAPEGGTEFKVVDFSFYSESGSIDFVVTAYMDNTKLTVRKTSDSLVDRVIEVVPSEVG